MGRRKKPATVRRFEQRAAKYAGRRLREWRTKRHMSLSDVTKATGIPAITLSEYERGKYLCPPDRLRVLATLYQAPLSEFALTDDEGVDADVQQIAALIREWPETERGKVVASILTYLESVRLISPPKPDRSR